MNFGMNDARMGGSTRISDLPDNPGVHKNPMQVDGQNTYLPMNVHPNPYMNGQMQTQNQISMYPQNPSNRQGPDMHVSAVSQPAPPQLSPEQQMMLMNMPSQRLPSRDIPQDTTHYSNDEQIVPNYIPAMDDIKDYVKDHELVLEENLENHKKKVTRGERLDYILSELQTPILVAVLFFTFQLPFLNRLLFKYLSFLSIYKEDGNLNLYGMITKSLIFASAYYLSMKMNTYFE
jgi:hypothetical protein